MAITRSKSLRDIANLLWLNKVNEEIRRSAETFCPDLVLSIKGEAVKPETIEWIKENLGARTALWYPDDPRFFNSLVRYIAPSYDYIFTASERAMEMYKRIGCNNVHFLPFACEPTVHRRVKLSDEETRLYGSDICFVGTYTLRRGRIIKLLKKVGLKVKVWGPYWKYFFHGVEADDGIYGTEMVKAFNAAKIVLNVHMEDDLPYKVNMRTFEATGSGAFLLTDNAYGIDNMFKSGEEVIVYNDNNELIKLARYYIAMKEERKRISERAQKRAYKEHTYIQRLTTLIKIIQS